MKTNRLIHEKSPYLLQHAQNPVDWYPWGEEAFRKAAAEDKPIFLSIGYSTCHWCHVMEAESFSSPEIAAILNENFIAIKVDREERPDIDNIYMKAVMAISGAGGWPLSVFLTPNGHPFFGGTYFPPEDRQNIPGLKTAFHSISRIWKEKRSEILTAGEALVQAIKQQMEIKNTANIELTPETLKNAFDRFAKNHDWHLGGFGQAPKFPMGHSLSFILRYWKRSREEEALSMVEQTLTQMARGGIYDHIGGGFHRYSTDAAWRIPHFEKMLYDQALLGRTYLEAYQATGKEDYARTAKEIFEYVLRDLSHPEGGFYSGEDADSAPDKDAEEKKKEGLFYLWTKDEIMEVLGKEEGEICCYYYGINKEGNAPLDPQGEFRNKNILYLARNLEVTAGKFAKSSAEIKKSLDTAKEKLFTRRSQRPRPHRDEKILVDWNGLMIGSLALASRVLNAPHYATQAEKAAQFILKNLQNNQGRILHRYFQEDSGISGMIDDYAFFIHGLIDLYEATFKIKYLYEAKRLAEDMLRLFTDEENGGFFFTGRDTQEILFRQKEIYDGAVPSGNSLAALDLLRLSRLTMDKNMEMSAGKLLQSFSPSVSQIPEAYPQMLMALDFALGPSIEIIIAANKNTDNIGEIIKSIYQNFLPNKALAFYPVFAKEAAKIIRLVPYAKDMVPIDGQPTVYICKNFQCNLPVTDLKKINDLLT